MFSFKKVDDFKAREQEGEEKGTYDKHGTHFV